MKPRRLVVPEGLPLPPVPETVLSVPGFRWLRRQTFSTPVVKPRTVEIYLCELFHQRLVRGGLLKENQTHPACEFVLVPGGEFLMGSPDGEVGRQQDEGPQHLVTVPPFLLARTPMVNAVTDQPQRSLEPDMRPWVNVSVDEAAFWLDASRMRLPSEAEWEYACRADSTTIWCFGDDPAILEQWAWYSQDQGPMPAGQKRPNGFGLLDMHGNVWELCQDTYQSDYSGAPDDGSAWVTPGAALRVIRGGGWGSGAALCRSAFRFGYVPGGRNDYLGFRPARSIDDARFDAPDLQRARSFAVAGPGNEPPTTAAYDTMKTAIARGRCQVIPHIPTGCEPSSLDISRNDVAAIANLMPAQLLARGWFRLWSCLYPMAEARRSAIGEYDPVQYWADPTSVWCMGAIDALRVAARAARNWRRTIESVSEGRLYVPPLADIPEALRPLRFAATGLKDALQSMLMEPGNRMTMNMWSLGNAGYVIITGIGLPRLSGWMANIGDSASPADVAGRLMLGAWPVARITEILRSRGRVRGTARDIPGWVEAGEDPPPRIDLI